MLYRRCNAEDEIEAAMEQAGAMVRE